MQKSFYKRNIKENYISILAEIIDMIYKAILLEFYKKFSNLSKRSV